MYRRNGKFTFDLPTRNHMIEHTRHCHSCTDLDTVSFKKMKKQGMIHVTVNYKTSNWIQKTRLIKVYCICNDVCVWHRKSRKIETLHGDDFLTWCHANRCNIHQYSYSIHVNDETFCLIWICFLSVLISTVAYTNFE